MGKLLSRFRSEPTSASSRLELINQQIEEIEEHRKHNQAQQKKSVAYLVLYSILLYLVFALVFFLYYFPVLILSDKFLYSLPLLLFPVIVYGIKKFLRWYFVKRITENDLKLAKIKEEKNQIIEDIMENETYKKATELLQKYAPNRLKLLDNKDDSVASGSNAGTPNSTTLNNTALGLNTPGTELRQRTVPGSAQVNASIRQGVASPAIQNSVLQTPVGAGHPPGPVSPQTQSRVTNQQRHMFGAAPGPPLPRQVIPRERSYMDKMFEYMVGDGPQNRYALICKLCMSHNGMALAEEFEYLGFRCCYCFGINPPRKQRPNAPSLHLDTTRDSDDTESYDEDDGVEPIEQDVDEGEQGDSKQGKPSAPEED